MNENQKQPDESMVIYRGFYEAIKNFPPKTKAETLYAILDYGFYGIIPQSKNYNVISAFNFSKPVIDKAKRRYQSRIENGRKGGAPKGNTNARKKSDDEIQTTENNQKTTENNLNDTVNVNDNVNDNDNINDNININDNDNIDDNVDENNNDTENAYVNENTKKEPGKAGPSTHTFGEYENVLLNGLEMARLITEFGYDGYNKSVEYLSRYIKRKPDYKSACHFEDLRGWVQDAVRKEEKAKADAQKASDAQKKYSSFADISLEDLYER